jgi:8-oxo-dGTP pyrophosphatase MutT (NUDIX family)
MSRLSRSRRRSVARYPFLELFEDEVVDRRGVTRTVVSLALRDWCVVAARTTDALWLLVEQHRYGIDAPTWEPAGGIVDDGESPDAAARRELFEETGFGGGSLRSLGWVHPNPALEDNVAHLFFADRVEELAEPTWPDDDIARVLKLTEPELRQALRASKISHALGVLALERAVRFDTLSADGDQ